MLTFTYKVAELISNAQAISMYRASSSHSQGNPGASNESTLTLEDESIMLKYLKLAANEVANAMGGYTKDLLDDDGVTALEAFEFTQTTPVAPTEAEDVLIFRVNMPTTFNTAYTNQILSAIADAIENFILMRIAKYRSLEMASYKDDFDNAISLIKEYLTKRTATITRSMNMF